MTQLSPFVFAQQAPSVAPPPVVEPEGVARLWLYPNSRGTGHADVLMLWADAEGTVQGELNGVPEVTAWKLNSYGQAQISIPRARVAEEGVRPGNRVLVQFDNGLPDWGGVIDLPRPWNGPVLTVTAYSAEWLMNVRRLRAGLTTQGTPGDAIHFLLNEARRDGWLGFEEGNINRDGVTREWQIAARTLLDAVQDAAIGYGDFQMIPVLQRGRIQFRLEFRDRRGRDHGRNVALEEGVNLSNVTLEEQGPIINHWTVFGQGTGWTADTRIIGTAVDSESVRLYGLRQDDENAPEFDTVEAATTRATTLLAETSGIYRVVSMDALDRPPARFAQYDVGDHLWVELYDQGFEAIVGRRRVIAREYQAATNVCALVTE